MKRTTNLIKANPETRVAIKKMVARLLGERKRHQTIADLLGISVETVHNYSKRLKANGEAFFHEKKRGRKAGTMKLLSKKQESVIRRTIVEKNPDQLTLPFALWNRGAVQEFIRKTFNVEMNLRTVSNYLKAWGFTNQKPVKKSMFQKPAEVREFMEKTYPSIKRQAVKEGAAIYWGDETGVNNQEYCVKGFAPKGHPPTIASFSKIEKINMISAVTNQGACSFMCYEENMTAELFIDFMKRLRKDAGRKVLFIVDNLRVHHSKLVTEWLKGKKDTVELFYISKYSPELNPDEYLNHNLKQNVHSGILPHTQKELRAKTEAYMNGLKADGRKVKKLFEHKNLQYIKALEKE